MVFFNYFLWSIVNAYAETPETLDFIGYNQHFANSEIAIFALEKYFFISASTLFARALARALANFTGESDPNLRLAICTW